MSSTLYKEQFELRLPLKIIDVTAAASEIISRISSLAPSTLTTNSPDVFNTKRRIWRYLMVLGWVFPLPFVITAIAVAQAGTSVYISECQIITTASLLLYGPIYLVIIVNMVLFIVIIFRLCQVKCKRNSRTHRNETIGFVREILSKKKAAYISINLQANSESAAEAVRRALPKPKPKPRRKLFTIKQGSIFSRSVDSTRDRTDSFLSLKLKKLRTSLSIKHHANSDNINEVDGNVSTLADNQTVDTLHQMEEGSNSSSNVGLHSIPHRLPTIVQEVEVEVTSL